VSLIFKLLALLFSWAILWLQVRLDYKKPWSDKRTRLHRWASGILRYFVLPSAVIAALAVVVLDDRASRKAEAQLAAIRSMLETVAAVVGVKTPAEIASAVEELKARVADQARQITSTGQTVRDLERKAEHAAPRRLSADRRKVVLSALERLKGMPIVVACRLMDGESCDFALDLIDVLREAGCGVPDLVKTSMNDFPGYVAVAPHGKVTDETVRLVETALLAAGIPARIVPVQENSVGIWYQDAVHLVVGRKSP
jgi:hypothetical protein